MKITLLVPTLNELDGMKQIMPRINKSWVDEILVVDAGNDGTYEYALSMGYKVIKQKSMGMIGAYTEAVAAAVGDVIITFSPDGNSIPELIPNLVEKMREGHDMVIVSRYLGPARSEDDDKVTAFGNWMFTKMINVLFRANYTDSLVIFRGWKKDIFRFVVNDIIGQKAGFEPTATIACAQQKLRVAEIPGDEPKRIGGIRKMKPLVAGSGILFLILREFFSPRFKKMPKPVVSEETNKQDRVLSSL